MRPSLLLHRPGAAGGVLHAASQAARRIRREDADMYVHHAPPRGVVARTGESATDGAHGAKSDSEKHSANHAHCRQGPDGRHGHEDEQGRRQATINPPPANGMLLIRIPGWILLSLPVRRRRPARPRHVVARDQGSAHSFPQCPADLIHGSVDRTKEVSVRDFFDQ